MAFPCSICNVELICCDRGLFKFWTSSFWVINLITYAACNSTIIIEYCYKAMRCECFNASIYSYSCVMEHMPLNYSFFVKHFACSKKTLGPRTINKYIYTLYNIYVLALYLFGPKKFTVRSSLCHYEVKVNLGPLGSKWGKNFL